MHRKALSTRPQPASSWAVCLCMLVAACAQSLGDRSGVPAGKPSPGSDSGPAAKADTGMDVVDAARDAAKADTRVDAGSRDAAMDRGTDAAPSKAMVGGPGCGLEAAAFCETFDAPAPVQGRAGELDTRRWSAGRLAPQFPSANGVAIGIGPGQVPTECRSGLPGSVYPDHDALICTPSSSISSPHLLVVAAAQNYGQNSYRIRQPFDFAGRTGKIVFDAEAFTKVLLGWISLEITPEPINAPSFAFGAEGINNDEGSLIPPNAIEFQFQNSCDGYVKESSVSLRSVAIYDNYALTELKAETPTCVRTQAGKLNHFEIAISQHRVEVRGTPYSEDGKKFDDPELIYAADINLPFSRGYVNITTHNHASLKYSDEMLQAWLARWDNVGFDGPIITNTREYEVPDSLVPGTNANNRPGPVVSVGYRIPDRADAPLTLMFRDVDLVGATSATLTLSTWYLTLGAEPAKFALRYRWNGGDWHDRPLTAGELGRLTSPNGQGQICQLVDVSLAELHMGPNLLEFNTVNVPQSYPPLAANIDLVLKVD